MNTIIFDTSVDGHHLEYLNHIYCLCATRKEDKYVFVIPEGFDKVKSYRTWPEADNIIFDFITQDDITLLAAAKSPRKSQKVLSAVINKKCKKNGIYNVFTNGLLALMPFAPFYLNHKVRLSGIIYDIYDYQQQNHPTFLSKIPLWLCYQMMSHCKTYKDLFLLNDNLAPSRLNNKFFTKKFKYIPDPYVPLPSPLINIREAYKIPREHKVYAHIGSMSIRKGTLVCLEAITKLTDEELSRCAFIFAGHLGHFEKVFTESINTLGKKANIIIHNEFCTYEYLAAVCEAADYILVPYLETMRSSGIIGYASQFNTPVIGPTSGLMGKLIADYNLGLQLHECNVENLAQAIRKTLETNSSSISSDYCMNHTIEAFQDAIGVAL